MIFIPSYKRPKNCKAAKLLGKAVICCHSGEVAEYKKNNSNEIMEIPDKLAGKGMGVIRNWILKKSPDDDVMMVDDDVSVVGYFDNKIKMKMSERQIYRFIENGFRMVKGIGSVLWGVNLLEDKKAYREYSPFSLSSVVLGCFMGIVRNDLKFDEGLGLKEDFDYSIQVLNKYRKVLRFNKYHYIVDHLVGSGGCTAYRTLSKERQQKKIFIKKWGSGIVKFEEKDMNPIVRVPIAGI